MAAPRMCAPEEQQATMEEARTKPPGQLPFPLDPLQL